MAGRNLYRDMEEAMAYSHPLLECINLQSLLASTLLYSLGFEPRRIFFINLPLYQTDSDTKSTKIVSSGRDYCNPRRIQHHKIKHINILQSPSHDTATPLPWSRVSLLCLHLWCRFRWVKFADPFTIHEFIVLTRLFPACHLDISVYRRTI